MSFLIILPHFILVVYSAANDPRPQSDPQTGNDPQNCTAKDPRCGPQMIPPERDEWHGVLFPGFFFDFCIYLFIFIN